MDRSMKAFFLYTSIFLTLCSLSNSLLAMYNPGDEFVLVDDMGKPLGSRRDQRILEENRARDAVLKIADILESVKSSRTRVPDVLVDSILASFLGTLQGYFNNDKVVWCSDGKWRKCCDSEFGDRAVGEVISGHDSEIMHAVIRDARARKRLSLLCKRRRSPSSSKQEIASGVSWFISDERIGARYYKDPEGDLWGYFGGEIEKKLNGKEVIERFEKGAAFTVDGGSREATSEDLIDLGWVKADNNLTFEFQGRKYIFDQEKTVWEFCGSDTEVPKAVKIEEPYASNVVKPVKRGEVLKSKDFWNFMQSPAAWICCAGLGSILGYLIYNFKSMTKNGRAKARKELRGLSKEELSKKRKREKIKLMGFLALPLSIMFFVSMVAAFDGGEQYADSNGFMEKFSAIFNRDIRRTLKQAFS
ncbi:hypothetical protein ACFLY6_00485 [Candidatus Dependentiae bacterium]